MTFRHLYELSYDESALLMQGLRHHELVEDGVYKYIDHKYADKYIQVRPGIRKHADRLIERGYMERHSNKRVKQWYRLTEKGVARAKEERDARVSHDPEESAMEAALNRFRREMAANDFIMIAGSNAGLRARPAFFNPYTGETLAYKYKVSRSQINHFNVYESWVPVPYCPDYSYGESSESAQIKDIPF